MKKFALAIGLILALSVSALAASVTLSGTLTFEGDYYSSLYIDNPTWSSAQYQYIDGHPIWWKAPEAKFNFAVSGDNYNFSMGATVSNKIQNGWVDTRTITSSTTDDVTTFTVPSFADNSNSNLEDAVSIKVQNAYIKGSGVLGLPGTWTFGQKYSDSDSSYTKAIWYTNTFGNITANGQYNFDSTKGWSADATLKLNDSNSLKGSYSTYKGKMVSGAANDDSSLIEATLTLGKASFKGSVFSTPVSSDLSSKSGPYYAATVSALAVGPVVVDAYAKYWSNEFFFQDKLYNKGHGSIPIEAGLANESSYVKATYNLNKDATSSVYGKYWFDSDYEVSATLASIAGFKVVGTYGSYKQDATDTVADLEEMLRPTYPDIDLGSDFFNGESMTQWSVSAEKTFNNVTYKAAYAQTGKVAVTAVYKF